MKLFRILYFHIYNSYYKDGNYSNDIPHLTSTGIVGCSLSLLLTTAIAFVKYQLNGTRMNNNLVIGIIAIGVVIIAFATLYQKRYDSIYKEIKGSAWDNMSTRILTWITTMMGFIAVGIYAYAFNR